MKNEVEQKAFIRNQISKLKTNEESETSKPTATDDKKSDWDSLEKRLCKKIDNFFALLEDRIEKEFQLLQHLMMAN
ncbi:hypothetical protein FPOAC1_011589 [Fusarium poae]|uniref:hypothetical protein n=1 Tax=Fusarium poae TaxID=36050 RepID=UPI001CEBA7FA|nr:hypothetical protein FPOAC1_011589 [Fusarium poae]KAG8666772.1 hypothetical protein FPOAC1_011589 [Fusarium poae]